jgi:hypothetical protein
VQPPNFLSVEHLPVLEFQSSGSWVRIENSGCKILFQWQMWYCTVQPPSFLSIQYYHVREFGGNSTET